MIYNISKKKKKLKKKKIYKKTLREGTQEVLENQNSFFIHSTFQGKAITKWIGTLQGTVVLFFQEKGRDKILYL